MRKPSEGSSLLRFFAKVEGRITAACAASGLARWFHQAVTFLKASWLGRWLMQQPEEVELFSSSAVAGLAVEKTAQVTDNGKKAYRRSSLHETWEMLRSDFFSHPIFAFSVVLLAATLTNTVLMLFFKELDSFGWWIRALLIAISCLGLFVKSNARILFQTSRIRSWFSKKY